MVSWFNFRLTGDRIYTFGQIGRSYDPLSLMLFILGIFIIYFINVMKDTFVLFVIYDIHGIYIMYVIYAMVYMFYLLYV